MENERIVRLVVAAQNGDTQALNELFDAFYNDVYYFALKTVKDETLACDITQESFVDMINGLSTLQEPTAFVKWMRQITYRQCTRYFRKKKDVLVDEDEDGNTIFDIVAEDRTEFIPDEALDQQDFRKTILAMLDELSEEQRSATLLYYYDELSVKQIAEIQGVSEGTVKSRLNYARKSIKNSVETYEKKNNVKLHSFAFLPFMFWLLRSAAKESEAVAAASLPAVASGISAATGATLVTSTSAAAATAAGTGLLAKIAAIPLATKIVAGVVAACITTGGIGLALSDNANKNQPNTNTSSLHSSTSTTAPTGSSIHTNPPLDTTEDDALIAYKELLTKGITERGLYIEYYAYWDLNEDGIPELVVSDADGSPASWSVAEVYTYRDSEVFYCGSTNSRYDYFYHVNNEYLMGRHRMGNEYISVNDFIGYMNGYTDEDFDYYNRMPNEDSSNGFIETATPIPLTKNDFKSDSSEITSEPTSADGIVPDGCTYILANGTELAAGEPMPETSAEGDRLITRYYQYTCIAINDALGWNAKVKDTHLESYPALLNSINKLELLTLKDTFSECQNMIFSPNIPHSVVLLFKTYHNCSKLLSITIPSNIIKIGDSAFYGCSSLVSVIIPDSVITIGTSAFKDCTGLISLTIGENVASISNQAFNNCTALEKLYYNAVNCADKTHSNQIFSTAGQSGNGIDLVIGSNVIRIPAYIFNPKTWYPQYFMNLVSVSFEENSNCYEIGEYAFQYCIKLKAVTIPNSIATISQHAFDDCSSLTNITFSENGCLTSIGSHAFSGCKSLQSITIPEGVKSIADYMFYGCESLSDLTIPSSITYIGDKPFGWCSSLHILKYAGSTAQWNSISKHDQWSSSSSLKTVSCFA